MRRLRLAAASIFLVSILFCSAAMWSADIKAGDGESRIVSGKAVSETENEGTDKRAGHRNRCRTRRDRCGSLRRRRHIGKRYKSGDCSEIKRGHRKISGRCSAYQGRWRRTLRRI